MNIGLVTLLARQAMPEKFGAVKGKHGRIIMPGQLWESNDRRRPALIRIGAITDDPHPRVYAGHLLTGKVTTMKPSSFTIGSRGWSLVQDVI